MRVRFRTLNAVERVQSAGILFETSINGDRVARFLGEIAATTGLRERIVVDNGPELISNALDKGRMGAA